MRRSTRPRFSLHGVVLLLLCLVIIGSMPYAFAQTSGLRGAWRQKAFEGVFSDDRSSPKIENGYLLSFRRTLTDSTRNDAVLVESLASGERHQFSFWPDYVSVVWVADVCVTLTKHLIIVGSLLRPDDVAPRNFASEVDFEGRTLNTVDLGTYEPELTCATRDGSFWTLGQDWTAEASGSDYQMLRNYSLDSHMIKSALKRKDLPDRVNLSARLHFAGGRPGKAFLVCGEKSTGAYIGPAITWVEVALSNGAETTSGVKLPPPRARITGLALLGEQVYGSFVTTFKDNSTPQQGLYKLNLSEVSAGIWEPVGETVAPVGSTRSFSRLIGADSGSLVYLRNEMLSNDGAPILYWSKPTD